MKNKYYLFLTGRGISSLGNWFVTMAIPFIIYDITGSAMAVSMSFLLETFPIILLSPLVSYYVDNVSRKKILQLCEMTSATAVMFCVITRCENLCILYIMCMILAVNGFIYSNTVNSYVPDICGNLDNKKANSLDSLIGNISMIVAPMLAGVCIKNSGYIIAFIIDIISFIISFSFFCFLKDDVRTKEKISIKILIKKYINHYTFKGFNTLIYNDFSLKIIIIICILFSTCGAIFSALDAVYIAEIFNGSSEIYGYINSAWGIGMISTSLIYFIYKNISNIKMFSIGIFFMGIATIGYGLSKGIILCILFNFLGGLANTLYVIYYKTLIQDRTNSYNRGSIFTFQSTLSKITAMIMVSVAGVCAEIFSIRIVIVFVGVFTVMLSIICTYLLNKYE